MSKNNGYTSHKNEYKKHIGTNIKDTYKIYTSAIRVMRAIFDHWSYFLMFRLRLDVAI